MIFKPPVVHAQPNPLGTIVGPDNNLNPREDISIQFNEFVSFLLGFMTTIGALFFLFQILIAAYTWLNSGGNEKNIIAARMKLFQGLFGLVILVAAYAIVGLVASLFGIPILTPLCLFDGAPCPT